ncbi:molybdopterin molybdotransferase MoeA [Commensalibacter oyaizuii]|uniref:Molybdopterin molybdenumtransferase n=1 Tax=Commensalibacter oyaizuii TaxID=3043873 RepID=A0ABT6Q2F2_9PROT|nr:gephyrin-like molybdotransferase Glp [Commensalibacter sp. TBRC 16381]MDI2091303.1 molybdopterin molybdotransferase MoeA [Commensalibacter sp. TBRC 16381]
MLDYYQALHKLLTQTIPSLNKKRVALIEADHLILAEDLTVQYDTPFFSNSAMDGYALGGDIDACQEWKIIHRIAAGDTAQSVFLKTGEAARIFTGAPIPEGTTAIIQQENTQVNDNILTITSVIKKGQNIRYKAEELKKGNVFLSSGQYITPAVIALLASQGYATIPVFKPLTIYVFSTGNELLNPGEPLTAGKIYDANRYLLLSWLKQTPHHIIDAGTLPDNKEATEQALNNASQKADIIITSGGVSVGEEDHVHTAIAKLGKLTLWKLAIKPGKPFAWGEINNSTVFMLPGNPVSTFITFQQLVVPALKRLSGIKIEQCVPKAIMAKAMFSTHKKQNRKEFLRVQLQPSATGMDVKLLSHQGSAMLSTFTQANALAEIPEDTLVHENDYIKVYPLSYNFNT